MLRSVIIRQAVLACRRECMSHINVTINVGSTAWPARKGRRQEVRLSAGLTVWRSRVGELKSGRKFGEIGDKLPHRDGGGAHRVRRTVDPTARNPGVPRVVRVIAQRPRLPIVPGPTVTAVANAPSTPPLRPHRKASHASAQPHHRRRRRDWVMAGVPLPSRGG
jgi:hypothetical protein